MEQLTRAMSPELKFVLDSDKVADTEIAPITGSAAPLARTTVGAVKSAVRESVFETRFPFPEASVNISAATAALNSPLATGVNVKL
jgi:hypothetical protein